MIDGACFLAYLNNSRIFLAPIPTYIYLNYAAFVEKNGTLAYPAHALANEVFPVPDGP